MPVGAATLRELPLVGETSPELAALVDRAHREARALNRLLGVHPLALGTVAPADVLGADATAALRAVKRDAATANLVAHLQAMRRLPQREEPAVVLVMQWLEETLERRGAESRNLSVRVAADLREDRL